MKLNFKKAGKGEPLIILHGLFGSLDNWATVGKKFSEKFTVYLVDQRNHGHSFHNEVFDYESMSSDLGNLINSENLDKVNLIGHSMGGKTAMFYSVNNPEKVKNLIVVDISPKYYPVHHREIIDALLSLDLEKIVNRNEAEELLERKIADLPTRQFLLKNLHWRKSGHKDILRWRFNLDTISRNIEKVGEALPENAIFNGNALFLKGGNSNYISQKDEEIIFHHFPNAEIKVIKGAGHWVHAEKPDEIIEAVLEFLSEN